MPGNSFGKLFTITTAGESHGPANVVIIDGSPPNIEFNENDIQVELDRRRPGQNSITTKRNELDKATILSGVFKGKTTGTPIAIIVYNKDHRSNDYNEISNKYRPGHADLSFDKKYGFRDYRGGGRSSARETVSRVAAGSLAKKILNQLNIHTFAYTKQISNLKAKINNYNTINRELIEKNLVRCPDQKIAKEMINLIKETELKKDSLGGICEIITKGLPAGLGEPVFDKLKADLSKALLSLPATTSFEYGTGKNVANSTGSINNDTFTSKENKFYTKSNNHGGILGGISTGELLLLKVAVKPTSSIPQKQNTIDSEFNNTTINIIGRHDPCILPRFIPIAEAMVNLVLVDHLLRWRSQCLEIYNKWENSIDKK